MPGAMPRSVEEENGLQIKVLIVDDDQPIAELLKELISTNERSVDVCNDGVDAIESIQKTIYDLIIVDLVMPRVGGLDVLKYAKTVNPDAIVIILTGYASLETAITAIKEGAYDYIRKPCKLEEIKLVVDHAIEKISLYRENKALLNKLQDAYQKLMMVKQEKDDVKRIENIKFFSSSMPSLHYIYNNPLPADNYVSELQALSSLKRDGLLTDSEFGEFKEHLLKMIKSKS
jgi:YesN/AraC family two-component response regulator